LLSIQKQLPRQGPTTTTTQMSAITYAFRLSPRRLLYSQQGLAITSTTTRRRKARVHLGYLLFIERTRCGLLENLDCVWSGALTTCRTTVSIYDIVRPEASPILNCLSTAPRAKHRIANTDIRTTRHETCGQLNLRISRRVQETNTDTDIDSGRAANDPTKSLENKTSRARYCIHFNRVSILLFTRYNLLPQSHSSV